MINGQHGCDRKAITFWHSCGCKLYRMQVAMDLPVSDHVLYGGHPFGYKICRNAHLYTECLKGFMRKGVKAFYQVQRQPSPLMRAMAVQRGFKLELHTIDKICCLASRDKARYISCESGTPNIQDFSGQGSAPNGVH